MWAPLQNPSHVRFYEELQAERHRPDEDWQPMIQAVRYLQSLPVASSLFAFTSLTRLHVTTSPSYGESRSHSSVCVIWSFQDRHFRLSFDTLAKGWAFDRQPEHICYESSFTSSIEPFIHRLLPEPGS
jgi:hypothetical protein